MRQVSISCLLVALLGLQGVATLAQERPRSQASGVLILAHGGSREWNDNVNAIAGEVNLKFPAEVALGMAQRASLQGAVDRLVRRGVTSIVAVPLFVSSHSSIITSTNYLLGLRPTAPPELRAFASMAHGAHAGHEQPSSLEDAMRPVVSPVPIVMTPALDAHPLVIEIVRSRAAGAGREPAAESVVLVAHGPNDDETDARWLAELQKVAAALRKAQPYRHVDAITLRDDAPAAVRDKATAALRALVQTRAKDSRVLVVPVLLSFGGIEKGLRDRLGDLPYALANQGLAPDPRLVRWVLEMVEKAAQSPKSGNWAIWQ